jgi:hypothetical protein
MMGLRDGDEVSDREQHMIQSPKLMLTFVSNLQEFQVGDAMRKGEMFTAAYYIRNILNEMVARRGERSERRLIMHVDNARPYSAKVRGVFRDDNFFRIARYLPSSLDLALSDFSSSLSNTASKNNSSGLQINLSRDFQQFWTKATFILWNRISGSRSTDWTDALQQMEST